MFRALGTFAAVILAVGASTNAAAATISAVSCSAVDVQGAINRAANGDTVTVPAGRCTWSTQVVVPHGIGITVQGAGIGQTVITRALEIRQGMLVISATTAVTGFTFDWAETPAVNCSTMENGHSPFASSITVSLGANGNGQFRIHDNAFVNIQRRGIWIVADGVIAKGLVDHNTFKSPASGDNRNCGRAQMAAHDNCDSGLGAEDAVMSNPLDFGSPNAVFFEDNVLMNATHQDGGFEGYGCARDVKRFNQYYGVNEGHHGTEGQRGTQQYEYYNNHFDVATNAAWTGRWYSIRSGTGFIFNNTSTAEVKGGMQYYVYRVDFAFRPGGDDATNGKCDGTSWKDGNDGYGTSYPAAGWPCIDSPGWWFNEAAGAPGGAYLRSPAYAFGNRRGGLLFTATNGNVTHMAEDVEYFNEKPSFDGASGVGIGTRAQMDAISCSRDYVGFWVTDEGDWNRANGANPDGRLYVCRSNRWTLYYTPYTYPHPLTGSTSTLEPPRNLRIVP